MNKIINFLAVAAVSVLLTVSCKDYLDSDFLFDDRMSTEDVFTNKDYSERWLARAYNFLSNNYLLDITHKNQVPFNFADDMVFCDRGNYMRVLKNGEYTENTIRIVQMGVTSTFDMGERVWEYAYQGVRHASIFIHNIDMNTAFTPEVRADMKAQARFLRAYFYWIMLRMYGPIPLLPDEGADYTLSYDELSLPRNSYEECADFIANELALAAAGLPLGPRDMNNIARPTRGAALALRAKVLVFAASPLMNGQEAQKGHSSGQVRDYASEMKDRGGKALLLLNYDESKWAKAAAAAKDVIDLGIYDLYTVIASPQNNTDIAYPGTITPPYNYEFSDNDWPNGWRNIDPFDSYRSLFDGTATGYQNPEVIFTRGMNGQAAVTSLVEHQLPFDLGWNCHGLTQKQVDAYYMKDGTDAPGKDKEIGRGDGSERPTGYVTATDVTAGLYKPLRANVSLQYANREPRFYASVGYNGSVWHARSVNQTNQHMVDRQVFYYRGENSGYKNAALWQFTGISMKKLVHPLDAYASGTGGSLVSKIPTDIRYAEVLLIYAEALNELTASHNILSWDGSVTHSIQRNVNEMKKGIRPIRIRGGVPDYEQDIYNNKDLFRAKLKRERQIELLAEGHRYFDLRRWMDSAVEEVLPIYGCYTYATSAQRDLFHRPVPVPQLPTTFSRKMWFWPIPHRELERNKNLTQNPGWTYPDI